MKGKCFLLSSLMPTDVKLFVVDDAQNLQYVEGCRKLFGVEDF